MTSIADLGRSHVDVEACGSARASELGVGGPAPLEERATTTLGLNGRGSVPPVSAFR